MIYTRTTLLLFASFYCLCLALFSFLQNPRVKLNLLFAGYNLCNAAWNIGEIIMLMPSHALTEILLRITGIGGCFFFPLVLHFTYELAGIAEQKTYRQIIRVFYFLGVIFGILHQTPFLNTNATTAVHRDMTMMNQPGPLYPFFALFLLSGAGAIAFPLPKLFRSTTGLKHKQIGYLLLACAVGTVAIATFFYSLMAQGYPWAHYPLQCLVSFIFGYTIFKHNLIHVKVAVKRALLLLGIFLILATIIFPLSRLYFEALTTSHLTYSTFALLLLASSLVFSLGPFFYNSLIHHVTLFQEKSSSHIAHELKSPLSAIQSAKEILEEELKKDTPNRQMVRDYMDMIGRNTERLEKFSADILNFNKADEPTSSHIESIEMVQLLKEVMSLFKHLGPRLRLNEPGPLHVKGSKEGLMLILVNLLSNAAKYSPEGEIVVQLENTDEGAMVSVIDHGIGVSKENLKKIFDPFVRVGTHSSHGSGLGLAIAKKWVEFHNGRIWAESEGEGKGTTITFTLPIIQ